jgi:hypothetical protein
MDSITLSALFFLLVPGVLITLPPGAGILVAALVHAIVFWVVQAYLARFLPWWAIWAAALIVIGAKFYFRSPAPSYY